MNFMKLLTNFMESIKVLTHAEEKFDALVHKYEYRLGKDLKKLRRQFFRTTASLLFYVFGFAFLITSLILFGGRYFSYDVVFVAIGAILVYLGILMNLQ